MKKKVNKDYLIAIILFSIIMVISWNFVKGFNAYDTYKMYQLGYLEYAKQLFFADGRIFSGFYVLIANSFHIFQEDLYRISIILCIMIVVANVVYFKNLILKIANKKVNNYLILVLALITIFNFTYADNMRFIEMPIIALSIFLYIIAAKQAVVDKNYKKMLFSLLIAVFMYQGTINVFFIMTIFLYLQEYQTINKKMVLEGIKILFLSMIPIVINIIYMKIYGSVCIDTQRTMTTFQELPSKFIKCLATLGDVLIYSKSVMPKNFYIMMLLINIILLLFLLLLRYNEKRIFDTCSNIILLVVSAFISCLPVILFFTINDIDYAMMGGRMFWAIGAIYGLMMLQLYLNTDILENKYYKIIFAIITFIYVVVLYFGMNNIMRVDRKGNDLDRIICNTIKENIEAYEKNNNCKVEKLKIKLEVTFEGIYKDEKVTSRQSWLLCQLPSNDLLKYYSGLNSDLDMQYVSEKVTDFKKNIDFYYIEDTAYVYINI